MIQLHPRALAAAALVATTLLAGCSTDTAAVLPAPTAVPSATPSETVEPTPVVTPSSTVTRDLPVPVMDELAKEFSQDGATGFAYYYLQVLNYSRNSGDVEVLRSIHDDSCINCENDVLGIQQMLENGYSHVDLETRFLGTEYRSWAPEIGEVQMDVHVTRAPHVIVDREGNDLEHVPGTDEATFFLWLKWIDGRWIIWDSQ